jgi:RHS repeat-associated protein
MSSYTRARWVSGGPSWPNTRREFDFETGLYYYRARYYDAQAGRFVSEDPIRFDGEDTNLYRYVRNRPSSYFDPLGWVAVDPNFDPECLPALRRALDILKKVARLSRGCNCAFKRLSLHRSLSDLVDDPNITIHSAPNDNYLRGADGGLYVQAGFTPPYDTHNIFVRPWTCRMGRWQLADTIVHELAHVGTGSVPGDEGERQAQDMERTCGLR